MKPPVSLKDLRRQQGIVRVQDVMTPDELTVYHAARIASARRRVNAEIVKLAQHIADVRAARRRRGLP